MKRCDPNLQMLFSMDFCIGANKDLAQCKKYGSNHNELRASNELCVDRPKCEALCTAESKCTNIDMHRSGKSCYLSAAAGATCSFDVNQDRKGLTPPVGGVHIGGYRHEDGQRFPNGYSHSRRLDASIRQDVHVRQSDVYDYFRKASKETYYTQTMQQFCPGHNLDIAPLALNLKPTLSDQRLCY